MRKGLLYFFLFVFYAVLLTISMFSTLITGYHLWLLVVALFVAHSINAFQTVQADELVVSDIYGVLSDNLEPGVHFLPFPMKTHRVTKTDIIVNFGTIDETLKKKVKESEDSLSWYVLEEAIRITFGDARFIDPKDVGLKTKEEVLNQYGDDILAKGLTVDPHFYFVFGVHNLTTLITKAGGIKEAIDRLKSACVTVMTEKAGKTFVAYAQSNLVEFTIDMLNRVEYITGDPQPTDPNYKNGKPLVSDWGVDVKEVRIESLGIPHRTNSALVERSTMIADAEGKAVATVKQSRAEREATENAAFGNATRIRETGNAEADAIKAKGDAEAVSLSKRAKAMQKPGGEIMAKLDAWKAGMEHGKVVILPADGTLLTEVLKASTAITASKT